ncbi:MAG: hypothetical protein OEV73_02580 [Desulfobulbaceae bacterium]|nr:hypothetical protein [Desulfobulbaceae bacterium]
MRILKTLPPLLLVMITLTTGGCGTVQQSPATTGEPAVADNTGNSGKGQLEQLIDTLAGEAKQSMRSCTATLKDVVVEATPMWSLNYQGEVHVRVYDAAGNLILDEYRK